MRFLLLATFVILHHFLFEIGHVSIFMSFTSWVFINIDEMSFLGLLRDNLRDWWKCFISSLRSVNLSSGVKTWRL